jgi:hypothetical protein
MGQCIGLDLLRQDVDVFRKEHAQMSANLSQLKDEFYHLSGELEEHCEDITKNMKVVEDTAKPKNAEYALIVSQNGRAISVLKQDIVNLHIDAVTAAQSYNVLRQGLRKLQGMLAPSGSPVSHKNTLSFFKDEGIMDGKPPTTPGTSKRSLTRPNTQFINRRTIEESPSNSSMEHGDDNNLSRKSRKRSKANMKRGATTPNLNKQGDIDYCGSHKADGSSPGIMLTVEFERGESLGLMLHEYYNKTLRNGANVVAQLIVIGYVSNGVRPNPAYQAGVVVDDVICGVNGQCFGSHEELSAALIHSYHESDEARHRVNLMLSNRGDPNSAASKRRLLRSETLAKTKQVVIRSSHSKDNKKMASKRQIEHVRKDEHPVKSVAKCGIRIWKFIVHRVTTKAFRKVLGKKLRKYCCRGGLAAKRPGLEHAVSMRHSHRKSFLPQDGDDKNSDGDVDNECDDEEGSDGADEGNAGEEYGDMVDNDFSELDDAAFTELNMLRSR